MKKAKAKNNNFDQTAAFIDLKALAYNIKQIKKSVSSGVKVLATVKANAYGHGMKKVAEFLQDKVDCLGVASAKEGLLIRKQGIKTPILVLGNTFSGSLKKALRHNIILTVTELEMAKELNRCAARCRQKAKIHIKVDTGMGRIGFWHEDALEAIKSIASLKNISLEGLYTHLSSAETDKKFTLLQLKRFNKLKEALSACGIKPACCHAANSIATVNYREAHFNMVRPGLILYGVYPQPEFKKKLKVKPVLSFKARIAYLKEVEAGRSISYGRTYITDKKSRIATLCVGYADGYSHLLTHKAEVIIRGKRAPVVGKICMDQIMVDVSGIKGLKIGQPVTLIGQEGRQQITVEELAGRAGTISYEILCWISQRVERIYI